MLEQHAKLVCERVGDQQSSGEPVLVSSLTLFNVELVQGKGKLLAVLVHEELDALARAVLRVVAKFNERAEVAVALGELIGVIDLAYGDCE